MKTEWHFAGETTVTLSLEGAVEGLMAAGHYGVSLDGRDFSVDVENGRMAVDVHASRFERALGLSPMFRFRGRVFTVPRPELRGTYVLRPFIKSFLLLWSALVILGMGAGVVAWIAARSGFIDPQIEVGAGGLFTVSLLLLAFAWGITLLLQLATRSSRESLETFLRRLSRGEIRLERPG